MEFKDELSKIQQKMAASPAGIKRRQSVLEAINPYSGMTLMDIGCGAGHFVQDLSLAVGNNGLVYGLDPSADQLKTAKENCSKMKNVQFLLGNANQIELSDSCCDAISAIQVLEYIKEVDDALAELVRIQKNNTIFVNVSVLWDHFGFYGPEEHLNQLIHDAFKAHCHHQMLPFILEEKLLQTGFKNISHFGIPFLINKRNKNSPANFAEIIMANCAKEQGISTTEIAKWQEQLAIAGQNNCYGFTSYPVLTQAYADKY